LFAFHKMPLRSYLMAIAIFANEVKGKSMLALSRDLGVQYRTAFVLAHKMREAMASEVRRTEIGGIGKQAEIDGAYFGGHVKPTNRRENRRDRRLSENRSGKRKVVVVIRERGGKTLPGVFESEAAALSFLRSRIARGTEVHADEHQHGTIYMVGTPCTGSTTKRRIALTTPSTPTTQNRSFPGCGVVRSATIITLLDRISYASRKSRRGARTIPGAERQPG